MAQLDEVKEILNTLRVGLSILIGLIVITTGSLINKEQLGQTDIYFWLGIGFEFILLIAFVKVISSIKKYTKKIKDL